MEKTQISVELLKKYDQGIVYNYSDYPTKDNWSYEFKSEEYKKSLITWLKNNKKESIIFYVHIPFCEQLCFFCLCSKIITSNYEMAKDYLYNYLFKELDLLFNFLKENKIDLNVREIYFGGGSPTFYNAEDFGKLVDKLKSCFNFNNVGDFTVEVDPRRVDAEKLLFYNKCGVNRLSFGVQEFDHEVQKKINRVQPAELFEKILTDEVRKKFNTFNFDLLIGLPGQTEESLKITMEKLIKIKPPQVQPMLLAYKPWVGKQQLRMVKDGPLPDFYDRKKLFEIARSELELAGYNRAGFETYVLPGDPIDKAMKDKKAVYNSLGVQKGVATNFIAIGSSAINSLGFDYYAQNFYSQDLYKKAIDKGELPIYRGVQLDDDDKVRRFLVNTLRTFFEIDFKEVEKKFNIRFREYFSKELNFLKEYENDKLVKILEEKILVTKIGEDFSPQISNVFDKYDPPTSSYTERLEKVKKVSVHPS